MSRSRVSPSGQFVSRTVRVTADFANVLANTTGEVAGLSVPGAKVGDQVSWGPSSAALEAGLVPAGGFVTAANTVTIRIANVTVGAIDPASLTVAITCTKSN